MLDRNNGAPYAAVKNGVVTVVKPVPLPAKPASLTGMIDPAFEQARAFDKSLRTGMIDPGLAEAQTYKKIKPTGIIFTDPGVAVAQQSQDDQDGTVFASERTGRYV